MQFWRKRFVVWVSVLMAIESNGEHTNGYSH